MPGKQVWDSPETLIPKMFGTDWSPLPVAATALPLRYYKPCATSATLRWPRFRCCSSMRWFSTIPVPIVQAHQLPHQIAVAVLAIGRQAHHLIFITEFIKADEVAQGGIKKPRLWERVTRSSTSMRLPSQRAAIRLAS